MPVSATVLDYVTELERELINSSNGDMLITDICINMPRIKIQTAPLGMSLHPYM